MLDIGWSELLVVVIVAVVVVGPKDLPRLMRTLGRYTAKARGLAREFRASFEELGRETELEELNREMEKIRREDPLSQRSNAIAPPLAAETFKNAGKPEQSQPVKQEEKQEPPSETAETPPPSTSSASG